MNRLIILVGVAGCGKTSYANDLKNKYNNVKIFSSDYYRKRIYGSLVEGNKHSHAEVFKRLHDAILNYSIHLEELNNIDNTVIIDATNLSRKRRKSIYNRYKKYYDEVLTIILLKPLDYLIKVQDFRPIDEQVPVDIVKRQYKSLEVPLIEYDTDIIKVETDKDYIYELTTNLLKETKHYSPYHVETINQHIYNAVRLAESESNNLLVDIAKWHDTGKFIANNIVPANTENYAKQEFIRTNGLMKQYIKHANVSACYYLSYVGNQINLNKDYQYILEVIYLHNMDRIKQIERSEVILPGIKNLLKQFLYIDRNASDTSKLDKYLNDMKINQINK